MNTTPEKIKQNKKYSAIFFLIVFVLCLVFSFPVSADPSFTLIPYAPSGTSDWVTVYNSSAVPFCDTTRFGGSVIIKGVLDIVNSSSAEDALATVFWCSATSGLVLVSDSSYTFCRILSPSGSASSMNTSSTFDSVNSVYYFSYANYPGGSTNFYIPVYSTLESGLAAASSFIASSSRPWQKLPYLIGSDELSNYSYYLSLGSRNGVSQYGATEAIFGIYPAVVGGSLFYLSDVNTNGVVSNGSTAVKLSTGLLDSSSQIYHSSGLSDFTAADNIPVFSDMATASASLREFLGGSSSATDLGYSKLVYDLPAGNAIYIPIPQNVSNVVSLTTTQPLQSVAYNVYDGSPSQTFVPFLHANQRYGYSNSLPSSANNVMGSVIPWYRASTGRNLLGQTKDAYYTFNTTDGYQYLYIVNPYYQNVRNVDSDSVPITSNEEGLRKNNSLHIEVQYAKNVKVYPLSMSVSYDGGFEDLSDTPTGQSYTGDISSGTGSPSFTDDLTGDPVIPGESTANTLPSAADTFGSSNNFQGWLQNFLSGFVGIFEVGHNAILTLVGYASAFFGVVGSLYAWLPSPVYTVLVSAISLVITIGIIKVFL